MDLVTDESSMSAVVLQDDPSMVVGVVELTEAKRKLSHKQKLRAAKRLAGNSTSPLVIPHGM